MPLKANPRLFAEAELLSKADPSPTPELLQQHYSNSPDCFWRRVDWRGRKGEEPSPAAIRETWGRWNKAAPVEHYVEYS